VEQVVQAREKAAAEDLARAEPFLEKATAALGGLDKASLTELKTFTKPHPDVLAVMRAVYALLVKVLPSVQAPRTDWRTIRTMMAKVDHFLAVRTHSCFGLCAVQPA